MNTYKTQDPYKIINLILAGIIFCIFVYSGLFSAEKSNHPLPGNSKLFTGTETLSTGLSRAFSEIIRLNFDEAKEWNENSLFIFGFFLIQLVMRMVFILLNKSIKKRKLLIGADIGFSVILFIVAFYDFLQNYYRLLLAWQ